MEWLVSAFTTDLRTQIDIPAELQDQIGNTPLIRLRGVTSHLPASVRVFAKAEWFNPSGSVKDRPAWAIIQRALEQRELDSGRVLLDSSSGNMGIAYATFCATLGIPVRLALPENVTRERKLMLGALGARLVFTDPAEGSDGARKVAAELAKQYPNRYFFADQYGNPANWQAHYESTGPEVASGTGGQVTHFVAGLGTGGTMTGAGRFLKQEIPDIQLIAVQPDGPLHGLGGLKHMASSDVPPIYDPHLVDRTIAVSTEAAHMMARRLAREDGLLVGVSSAAAAVAALQVGEELETGGVIVVMFPDSAVKYLQEEWWTD
jgi:cysteine synthase B